MLVTDSFLKNIMQIQVTKIIWTFCLFLFLNLFFQPVFSQTYLSEGFNSFSIPASWQVQNQGSGPCFWTIGTPDNHTMLGSNFLYVNSNSGFGTVANEIITSPVINVPNPENWRQPANFQIACEYLRSWSRWFAASELMWATFFDHQLFLANQRQPPYLDSQATNILLAVAILGSPILIAALLIRFLRELGVIEFAFGP